MSKHIEKDTDTPITCNAAEYSVNLWIEGYNCSQSIVMAFAHESGLSLDMAARIAGGFGFNAGREKEKTCGVVTGAIMVIGLQFGAGLDKDPYSKDLCELMIQTFIERFSARRNSVACKKVHQTNRHQEKLRHLTGDNAFCASVTRDAARILQQLLAEHLH